MRKPEEETNKEEMDELLKDMHNKEKVVREERDETKKRQLVTTIDVPTHENWKQHTKEEDNTMFLNTNINRLAHWSRDSNKAERLKHIFEKYKINSAGLQEVCMTWVQLYPSTTLFRTLQRTKQDIHSVASHNKS